MAEISEEDATRAALAVAAEMGDDSNPDIRGDGYLDIARAAIEAYLPVSSAYRKGQEDMRERAAKECEEKMLQAREEAAGYRSVKDKGMAALYFERSIALYGCAQAIRSLPVTGEKG